jgi:ubiquinone/menaquinone biosynthesis C-methylase UbiE
MTSSDGATSTTASAPLPIDEMERAYFEYRKGCYTLLCRAAERGLLEVLAESRTADEVAEMMEFLPERRESVALLLRALTRYGALRFDANAFVRDPDFSIDDVSLDRALIARAVGEDEVEKVLHGSSYMSILDALSRDAQAVSTEFGGDNVALWEEFLQAPFYRYGRERAVEAIGRDGAVVLDLAAGPGFGLLELADLVGDEGEVTGTEISDDFVAQAARRTDVREQIHVIRADLDQGLAFLRDGWFDAAMLVGALHYVMNRDLLFKSVARVLKPGGLFCLALVHMQRGSYDQELMDLRLSLRQPPATPATRPQIEELAERHGMELLSDDFSMGVYGWFLLRSHGKASTP